MNSVKPYVPISAVTWIIGRPTGVISSDHTVAIGFQAKPVNSHPRIHSTTVQALAKNNTRGT